MEEIKVNDYIKTKNGYIAQIININDFREPSMKYGVEANYLSDILFIGEENITKHSSNIIDLIEVGDYVNGYLVRGKTTAQGGYVQVDYYMYSEQLGEGRYLTFDNDDIKSIVTKEQFATIEYKVEE